jgi:hypothetical protein
VTGPEGAWSLTISTPIGALPVALTLVRTADGLHGTASSRDETVTLQDLTATPEATGVRLTWRQSVTRPIRLNLGFDVLATDDSMTGHVRAGRLPRSSVSGSRSPAT